MHYLFVLDQAYIQIYPTEYACLERKLNLGKVGRSPVMSTYDTFEYSNGFNFLYGCKQEIQSNG